MELKKLSKKISIDFITFCVLKKPELYGKLPLIRMKDWSGQVFILKLVVVLVSPQIHLPKCIKKIFDKMFPSKVSKYNSNCGVSIMK